MAYEVTIKRKAQRKLDRLPKDVKGRVELTIEELADEPRPPGARQMTGPMEGHWRVKVGRSHRVVYTVDDDARAVDVVNVGSREGIY